MCNGFSLEYAQQKHVLVGLVNVRRRVCPSCSSDLRIRRSEGGRVRLLESRDRDRIRDAFDFHSYRAKGVFINQHVWSEFERGLESKRSLLPNLPVA